MENTTFHQNVREGGHLPGDKDFDELANMTLDTPQEGEMYGCRFCKKCGSEAVAPAGCDYVDFFAEGGPEEWPANETEGLCECGHVGVVGRDIVDTTVPYYRVVRSIQLKS